MRLTDLLDLTKELPIIDNPEILEYNLVISGTSEVMIDDERKEIWFV